MNFHLQDLLTTYSTGRKAQNYFHHLSMTNFYYFDMLTVATQRKLMKTKTLVCFTLGLASFFFGHQATTSVGQV